MLLDRFRMEGRSAIVTAAGKGIGAACARGLAECGANVVIAARTQADIDGVADDIRTLGVRATAIRCDMTQREEVEALVAKTVEEYGRIDVLVNNVGGYPPMPALKTSEKAFNDAFKFNTTTAFLMNRLVIPHMLEGDGGSVVAISSAAGRVPASGFVAYGTAKAAMTFMMRNFAQEFAPRIRFNTIAVGSTATTALTNFLDDDTRRAMEESTPMKRLGDPEDIAMAAIYLASDAGSYLTGKVLEVDGGLEWNNWPFS
jgi:7-alpha-hydroxysteroid dehydrogenase